MSPALYSLSLWFILYPNLWRRSTFSIGWVECSTNVCWTHLVCREYSSNVVWWAVPRFIDSPDFSLKGKVTKRICQSWWAPGEGHLLCRFSHPDWLTLKWEWHNPTPHYGFENREHCWCAVGKAWSQWPSVEKEGCTEFLGRWNFENIRAFCSSGKYKNKAKQPRMPQRGVAAAGREGFPGPHCWDLGVTEYWWLRAGWKASRGQK